jgi:DnaJ-class molecular chaperone
MNPYGILGVDVSADIKEIKKSYKSLANKHHPDKGGDEELFKDISVAYEILSDQESRDYYDEHGEPMKAQVESAKVSIAKIMNHVKNWLQGGDLNSSLMLHVTNSLGGELNALNKERQKADIAISRMTQVKSKFSCDDEDFIGSFLDSEMAKMSDFYVKADAEEAHIMEAIAVMNHYTWTEIQTQIMSGASTSGTSTTGWV